MGVRARWGVGEKTEVRTHLLKKKTRKPAHLAETASECPCKRERLQKWGGDVSEWSEQHSEREIQMQNTRQEAFGEKRVPSSGAGYIVKDEAEKIRESKKPTSEGKKGRPA